ncbi:MULTISPECIES: hypothetical protein [Asticcacaulis]|uniref:hypothetical protein n=1 Tax=Asticcacaulis TaxID=76890 RepID=UPI001AE22FA1|nr:MULTISPECIES: hypothetical protein [Asticcacaulis]MBP2161405.1 hypothetical protein [Asticcacaulis solisilvae]MDR6802450.1 hypothetical protein [Asticcacaulis sp. BE141]
MSPVRFELDRRAFGVVNFARQKGQARIAMEPVQKAIEATLGVRVTAKREKLFGPKIYSFTFMGETVKLRPTDSGDARLDLGMVDDEVRETLLEHMRQSLDFEGR